MDFVKNVLDDVAKKKAEEEAKQAGQAGLAAMSDAQKNFNEGAVKQEVKVGNQRVDDTKFGALGSTLGKYDPRQGSGMYSGTAQYMAANAAQGARMANKAYEANELSDESVTFNSALGLGSDRAGTYDRALLAGYEGPSQERKAMTEEDAMAAVALRGGSRTIQDTLSAQFEEKQQAAKEEAMRTAFAQGKQEYVAQRQASRELQKQQAADAREQNLRIATRDYEKYDLDSFTNSVKVLDIFKSRPREAPFLVNRLGEIDARRNEISRIKKSIAMKPYLLPRMKELMAEENRLRAEVEDRFGKVWL